MHFEVLVEDSSGRILVDLLLMKMLGSNGSLHTWRIHAYRGIGRIPPDLRGKTDPWKRVLLNHLPRILAGYGKSLRGHDGAVIVVVDLDERECIAFKRELVALLEHCHPPPRVLFRIAIEESESWLLGDRAAILRAFPKAKATVLNAYKQDSVCGTWEVLADAVFPGGSAKLKLEGYPRIGEEKCQWAERIGRHLEIENNRSPSLRMFRDGVARLAKTVG